MKALIPGILFDIYPTWMLILSAWHTLVAESGLDPKRATYWGEATEQGVMVYLAVLQ